MTKLSCIMVCSDGLEMTLQTVRNLQQKTHAEHELILVDNASTDGTEAWAKSIKGLKYIRSDKNIGYANGINLGIDNLSPDSQYICVMNNDLVFSNNWDKKLIYVFDHPELVKEGVDKIGITIPISNNSAGIKLPLKIKNPIAEIEVVSKKIEENVNNKNAIKYLKTGYGSGFCMMISRECLDAVGKFDSFKPFNHGFEDNDFCLRSELAGYGIIVCMNTFVYHYGNFTANKLEISSDLLGGLACREDYYNKWKPDFSKKKKLVFGYRVKNEGKWFERVLKKASELADEIVVFDDNSTDNTVEIAKSFPKVKIIHIQTETTFNEHRDREKLLQLCKSLNPDWISITDGDEEFCEKCTRERLDLLMNPIDPQIYAYDFLSRTFWNDLEHIRTDGNFGNMIKNPLFRNLPNQHIANIRNQPQGFHCGSHPPIKDINKMPTNLRLKHYGYVDPEERKRKYDWYQRMDTKKDPALIGNVDYRHLIDERIELVKYDPNISISFTTIVKDEEQGLHQFLTNYHNYFDEMIMVDTGSSDRSREIIQYYKDYGVKLIDFEWIDDYSAARNEGLKECKSKWVMFFDIDESLGEYGAGYTDDKFWVHRLIEQPHLGYVLPKYQYLKEGTGNTLWNLRLFRNLSGIKFEALVHESVEFFMKNYLEKNGGTCPMIKEKGLVFHLNFLKDPISLQKKFNYYARLLQKELKQNPKNPGAHFSIALHFQERGDNDKAAEHFKQAIILDPKSDQNWFHYFDHNLRIMGTELEYCKKLINGNTPFSKNIHYISTLLAEVTKPKAVVGIPSMSEDVKLD